MRRGLLAGLGLVALMAPLAAQSDEIMSGRVTVLDGDTLSLRGRTISLHGIAAPGLEQACLDGGGRSYACGTQSARALADFIGDATVSCAPQQAAPDGRPTATCRIGTEDLGARMIVQGYATADRSASVAYVAQEKQAWAGRRGLWSGVFEDPAGRRRAPDRAPRPVADADAARAGPIRHRKAALAVVAAAAPA
jgi:endonuclease YncB( thermonuclease family)